MSYTYASLRGCASGAHAPGQIYSYTLAASPLEFIRVLVFHILYRYTLYISTGHTRSRQECKRPNPVSLYIIKLHVPQTLPFFSLFSFCLVVVRHTCVGISRKPPREHKSFSRCNTQRRQRNAVRWIAIDVTTAKDYKTFHLYYGYYISLGSTHYSGTRVCF